MGNPYDEINSGRRTEEPSSAAPSYAPPVSAPVNPYTQIGAGPAPPPPPQLNKPFGELKAADPTWTQATKWWLQDRLMNVGFPAYNAGHLSRGVVDLGNALTPMGTVLSAADLTHNVSRGNWGDAAWDALGVVPGVMQARRYIKGMPTTPMADIPRGKGDISFLPERGKPDPHGMGPYGLKPSQMPVERANDELKTIAQGKYRDTRYAPVDYHPQSMNDFTARSKQGLEHPELGFSPEKAPLVHSTLDRWVQRMEQRNTPISAQDWDTLRQQLKGFEGADGVAGNHVAGWIDQYMTNPPQGALLRGTQADLDALKTTFDEARGNYRSYKTAETVEKGIDRAGTKADVANSGMNVDNTTRSTLGSFTTTDAGEAKLFGARPDEIAAIKDVAKGDAVTNFERKWGNKLGGGGGMGNSALALGTGTAATSAAHLMGLDPYTAMAFGTGSGLAVGKTGTTLRGMANERTVRAAEDVVDLIRKNSPEYAARVRANPDITDPISMQRDAVAYAMIPQIKQQGQSIWDQAGVPYENREERPRVLIPTSPYEEPPYAP
jgi:hypothetical protein